MEGLSDGTVNSSSWAACFRGCNEVVVLVGLGGPSHARSPTGRQVPTGGGVRGAGRGAVLFFTASAQRQSQPSCLFVEKAAASTLPGAQILREQQPQTWDAALTLLAAALRRPTERRRLDEMPYLIASDRASRERCRRSSIASCPGDRSADLRRIGSGDDGGLNDYGRPFHQRATEMVVPPLSPADVSEMLDLSAADAFDAYLVSGGLPLILDEWPNGASVHEYMTRGGTGSDLALLVSGERALAAEFRPVPGGSGATGHRQR